MAMASILTVIWISMMNEPDINGLLSKGKTELWNVADLIPYENNAKKHSPEQIKKLVVLIKRVGWTQPIVVQKSSGSIIAGHGRRLAALDMGLKKVPVFVLDVSDDEAKAIRLADNRISSTDYDTAMIQSDITDLKDLGYDIDIIGFDEKELSFLTEEVGMFDEDAFVGDISEAVEAQKASNTVKAEALDEQDAPLAKSFGFKRLTIAQSRRVKAFMSQAEANSGRIGVAALMAHFDSLGIK